MDNNSQELLNSHSFLQQKINLTGEIKTSPFFEKELFLISKFTIIGFPMQEIHKKLVIIILNFKL